ncbi:MAG: Na/Pi cotransporter family protein [Magnetococcales bacterium]|nr:Na/Pi cotransporter family protein [Magnetococcales bacterium]NGZ07312.1 Na/Pi cotransporter family protein [Magnetococcales bacterium]
MSTSWSALTQVVTGATLFLYGLEKSLYALGNLHGEGIRQRLGALACHDLCGWLNGSGAGVLLFSNSILVELLGELAAGNLLACRQTLLMLLGGLLGTSLIAVIWVVVPTSVAVVPLVLGPVVLYVSTPPRWRFIGHLLLGAGLLFLGLAILQEALRIAPDLLQPLANPWLGVPVALVAAMALRSSHAVVGLLLPMAGLGELPLSTALGMVLAANLGAALPVALLFTESSAQLRRMFLAHLVFQGAGLFLVGWWVPQAAEWLTWLPFEDPGRLVLYHVLFNLLVAVIGLPSIRWMADLAHRLLPDPYGTETHALDFTERYWPRYLDDDLLETPTLALAMARREIGLIAALVEEMWILVPEALFSEDPRVVARMAKMDERVDEIHRAVVRYLAGIGGGVMPIQVADERLAAMTIATELEAIGDIIENNIGHVAASCLTQRLVLPAEMRTALDGYHRQVRVAFRQAADAYLTNDPLLAQEVMARKESISAMDARGRLEQMQALRGGDGADFVTYTLQMDLYEYFKRVFYHAKRIAKVVAGQ